jgi:hypothetical protein
MELVNGSVSYDEEFNVRRMVSSGLLRRVALVRTDVSEEPWYFFAAYVGC